MYRVNPYRPGAGLMPTFLAGREQDVQEMENKFEALKHDIPIQSVIYSGLRGVGKTVLMNKFYEMAQEKGMFCKQIEVEARKDFVAQIATCCQMFLRELSGKEQFKGLIGKALEAIKSLVVSFDPENQTFSLSVQDREFYVMSSFNQSLTDVFLAVGKAAQEAKIPICFFIDEIQYMKKDELSALIGAIHRVNQLGYPIMIIGAGLPKIIKMLSDAKSYSERLFSYKHIGSLSDEQAERAIIEPAKKMGVECSKEAVKTIVEITKGYPFFVQQFCSIVYERMQNESLMENEDVVKNIDSYFSALDEGFFKSRYERCSQTEKIFLFSMVRCGTLPCDISNVSKYFGKDGKSISPVRAKLIDKGIVYPIRYKELDFTVPEFDSFIKRLGEYNEWAKLKKK